jgi:NAD(P)-dependent dehydrogenase (short-subunit alcohol dehydrogenase family)
MQPKRTILVTGANKGIGLETARQLGKHGHTVLVGARDKERGEAAVRQLKTEGADAHFIELDVTSEGSIQRAAATIAKRFVKLDTLVNNAGINVDGWGIPTSKVPLETWRRTFDVNVFAVAAVTQAFLPLLRESPAGCIVNVSSILGSLALHADPDSPVYNSKFAAYDASKAALNAYTLHLAYELRDTPIKVNAAHPGWVKTDLGGSEAPMELVDGAKTSVRLATLPADGPTGGFFHMNDRLPW